MRYKLACYTYKGELVNMSTPGEVPRDFGNAVAWVLIVWLMKMNFTTEMINAMRLSE